MNRDSADAAPACQWSIRIDTGGTFTDCLAIDPAGTCHRVKVLSSGTLRGTVTSAEPGSREVSLAVSWNAPAHFARGALLRSLEDPTTAVEVSGHGPADGTTCTLEITGPVPAAFAPESACELAFDEEAPVLAARLVTGTAAGEPLPAIDLRLATTRGTNALLERHGVPVAFFVTRGFADLLRIGDQQRPDLFALDIRRPPPLYQEVVEVEERLDAEGGVLRSLDLESLDEPIRRLREAGIESAAVAFLHSYRNPEHEERLAEHLRQKGFRHVARSADLAPLIKILPRAETAVVDAYLGPIIGEYLERVRRRIGEGHLHMMTSAGGLVSASRYRACDSLLSGPAGGVVGAASSGRAVGAEKVIAFDMGGTSTDVSRFDGDYEYLFEHRVGDARVAAPALAIETVASGGGSICQLEAGPGGEGTGRAMVGPESAGARPGPACYGAGGPLTLTDVHLLLGRLDPSRFGIPVSADAARRAFESLVAKVRQADPGGREALLLGFLDIANERMADAVRQISVRRGYDPNRYGLVSFGGAGGLHACAVASLLGIETVIVPREAGLLSALGLGAAVIERFAQRQILEPLADCHTSLMPWLRELARSASDEVVLEGAPAEQVEVRRQLAFLRFAGQETSLELELSPAMLEDESELARGFFRRYETLYGYRPRERVLEVESLRVVASSKPPREAARMAAAESRDAKPSSLHRAFFGGVWREAPVYHTDNLDPGAVLRGPALVLDPHATLVVEPGWHGRAEPGGTLVLRRG